jgi:two-component system nitrate/nitrite response regulator NarL
MRLVICDDHRLLLEALATALAGRGFTVEATVGSPGEAVRAVALNDPDILLTDLSFPAGSGLDAAREVLATHPRTKVVVITASEQPEPLLEALAMGVSGYLAKDRSIDSLASALEEVARGGTSIDKDLLRGVPRASVSAPRRRRPLDTLTPTESRVIDLLATGMSTGDIVRSLGVTQSTLRTHVQNIFTKLDVHTRLQAVALLTNGAAGDRDAVRC